MIAKKDRPKILETADRFIRAGKLQDAIYEYEKLLDGEALDAPIANIIGDLYLRIGKGEKAFRTFQELASHYEAKGQYSQALAIYKKINKISPDDIPSAVKLAELYTQLGFAAEAKSVYGQVIDRLEKDKHVKGLIFIYEKLAKIDRGDLRIRLKLADLYTKDGSYDEAVELINEVVDLMLDRGEHSEAEKLLSQARSLKKNHVGTLLNYVTLLSKKHKKSEAISILEEALAVHKENFELLLRLGTLYLEDKNFRMAEEIFSGLYSKYPNDLNVRVKLGYALIHQNKVEMAYQIYEPLINTLLSKGRDDKAIGLIGLVFTAKEMFVPALEKLAVIYKAKDQRRGLEVALRLLLQECRRKGAKEKMLVILRELVELCPEDKALAEEFAHTSFGPAPPPPREVPSKPPPVREMSARDTVTVEPPFREIPFVSSKAQDAVSREAPVKEPPLKEPRPREALNTDAFTIEVQEIEPPARPAPAKEPPHRPAPSRPAPPTDLNQTIVEQELPSAHEPYSRLSEHDQEMIRINLNKAELYLQQGLAKNARRILENLLILYPEEPRITQKLALLMEPEEPVELAEAPARPKEPAMREARPELRERSVEPPAAARETSWAPPTPVAKPAPAADPMKAAEKVSAEALFAGFDLGTPGAPKAGPKYYDLQDRIVEERTLMESVFFQQFKKETAVVEKDLIDIIKEFRMKMESKVEKDNFELRYNIGLAFMEQGLYGEAIMEFQHAAQDHGRATECFTLIGGCYKKMGDYRRALDWLQKALATSTPGSNLHYAIKYDWASLLEEMNERAKAIPLYEEVKVWNAKFRDVSKRLRDLKKATA